MAMRSSWSRKRGEIGPGSEIITPPASRNHSDPQLVDTPTRRAAAAPIWPSRTSSKYRFFTEPGTWLEPPRGIGASHRATFATTDRTQAVYPIVYIDAIVVKIREGGTVDNRAAHLAIGVDVDGFKHVLGIWIAENEGAKFWQNVLNELVNRGLNDALIVCCDGLTGLPDAIANVWPKAIVQTCVVHLIRASTRFVSQNDRKAVIKSLRPIYEAVNEATAQQALNDLKHNWGQKYTGLISTWERAWEEFIPFLEFHPAIRKVIYTTNAIESMNYQLRKITKTRGHFPSTDSALKLIYLGIRNLTGRHIDGEGRFAGKRGTGTYGWNRALNAFATRFGDRLPL